jgi:3-mercaptopyruvate sulfurtransferase SseA
MKFIFSTFAVFALGLSVLTACQETASPTAKVETAKQTNANAAPNAKTDEHGHADEAARINLADAKKEFDAGNAVFIDTRAETAYNTEHIKGALNITENNFEEKYKEIPQGKKIIAYCS